MKQVLFLPLALSRELEALRGPIPPAIAARQIPRILAGLVKTEGSHDAVFVPFVGNDQGNRAFVSFRDLIQPEQISSLLPSLGSTLRPTLLIHGVLSEKQVLLRASCALSGDVRAESSLGVDLREPGIILNSLQLELWDILEIPKLEHSLPTLEGPAFCLYLIGKDEELALEANLSRRDPGHPFQAFLEALDLAPTSAAVQESILALAKLCIEQGREDPGLAAASLATAARIGKVDTSFLEAALEISKAGGNEEAIESLATDLVERKPAQSGLALWLASRLRAKGNSLAAKSFVDASVASLDKDAELGADAANLVALRHELQEELGGEFESNAAKGLDIMALEGLETLPIFAAGTLSKELSSQARFDDALAALDRASGRQADMASLELQRGRIWLLKGESEKAKLALQNVGQAEPGLREEADKLLRFAEHPESLSRLEEVEHLLEAHEATRALKLAKKLVKDLPETAEAWFLLGLALSSLGQRRRAVSALQNALVRNPDFPEASNRLGILLVGLGQQARGYEALRRALEGLGEQMGPLLHLAQACFYLDRKDEGMGYLNRAEARFPDHPDVAQIRTTLYCDANHCPQGRKP